MSTLSTSLYGSPVNKGFGGLASGLDTDDLVKQMTAATRNKINRQYQEKQKLLYRQEAYREISSKLISFSDKFFSYSSGTKLNILSSSFFKSNTVKSTSDYVNVTGDAESIKNFSITGISEVATRATFTSNKIVSNHIFASGEITQYTSSLAGETMTIEYDGKSYNLNLDKDFGKGGTTLTLQDVANQLNTQIDKIADLNGGTTDNTGDNKLTFSVTADGKLDVTSTEGKSTKLTAAGTKIINTLKMSVGQEAKSSEAVTVSDLTKTASEIFANSSITFDYNGVKKSINLNDTITDKNNLQTYLQTELNKAYGSGKINVELGTNNDITFSAVSETDIFGVSSISNELGYFTEIEADTYNRVNKNKSIDEIGTSLTTSLTPGDIGGGKTGYSLTVNGKEFKFEGNKSINDVISTINNDADAGVTIYYSSTVDKFIVKADETGSHKGVAISDVTGNLAASLFGTEGINYTAEAGKDTTISYKLNGVEASVTRSTANFSIDGINIELNEKSKGIASAANPVAFTVTNNSDEVVDRVKQFVNDYNDIISLLNTKTTEKPNREYQPLTPEQSDDMEKEEIENWTTEAKKGILFGDSNIKSIAYSLRSIISQKTSGSIFSANDIGISAANLDISGKLVFNEEVFRKKLMENPDEIANLFTKNTNSEGERPGLSIQIQDILKKNVGTFGGAGILIREAGKENGLTADKNYISEKIKDYDKKMAELKKELEAEKKKHWDKFTALEKTLNNLNSQSAMFTNMLGL